MSNKKSQQDLNLTLRQVARNYFRGILAWTDVLKAARDLGISGEVTKEEVKKWREF